MNKATMGRESLLQACPPEVINLVLQQLDFEQLRGCRLVCKALNEEACRILKKKGVLQLPAKDMALFSAYRKNNLFGTFGSLVGGGDVNISVGIWIRPKPKDTSAVMEVLRDGCLPQDIISSGSPLIPPSTVPAIHVTKLSIQFPDFSRQPPGDFLEDCRWLLTTYSPILRYISLYWLQRGKNVSHWLASTAIFPALELLEIRTGNWLTSDRSQPVFSLSQIFRMCPKIRTLKLNARARMGSSLEEQLPLNLGLKNLEIVGDSHLFEEIMALQPPLHLESLVVHSKETMELLPFLNYFAPTLTKLKICENDFFKRCPREDVPDFPVLTHLFAMETTVEYGEPWLLKMPSLQCLCVRRIRLEKAASEESLLYWELNGCGPTVEVIRSEFIKLALDKSQYPKIFQDFRTFFPHAKVWYLDRTYRLLWSHVSDMGAGWDVIASDDKEMISRSSKQQSLPSHFTKESTHMFHWNNDASFEGRRRAEETWDLPPLQRRKLSVTVGHVQELNNVRFLEQYPERAFCPRFCNIPIIFTIVLAAALLITYIAIKLRR